MKLLKNRKSQDLSLNTIIVAVIVLIVLIILIVVLSSKMTGFRKGVNTCDGYCVKSASDCRAGETPLYINGCDANNDGKEDIGNYCCAKTK